MYIETERLIIRNYQLSDEADLGEFMLQRVDKLYEGYPNFKKEDIPEEITFRVKSDEFFAIELKENHKVIGNIYLGKRDFNTLELGYVFNELYIGKGYGPESAKAVVLNVLNNGVHRVYAECAPGNIPSWRLMEKIGMRKEATLRKNVSFHQDEFGQPIYWDTYVYALLDEDIK